MPSSHNDYKRLLREPLEVEALFHCGQFRDIDTKRGINRLSRLYRVEPFIEGFITVHRNISTGEWVVESSLGKDHESLPLVCVSEITAAVRQASNWNRMEAALATYFNCPIFEFHSRSKNHRRLKATPDVDKD